MEAIDQEDGKQCQAFSSTARKADESDIYFSLVFFSVGRLC